MKKIFSTAPDGNEMADMANARYFNLAIKQIEENAEWLKTANKPTQALLAHIEILIMLAADGYRRNGNRSAGSQPQAQIPVDDFQYLHEVSRPVAVQPL